MEAFLLGLLQTRESGGGKEAPGSGQEGNEWLPRVPWGAVWEKLPGFALVLYSQHPPSKL